MADRTYDQMMLDARELVRALMRAGWDGKRIRHVVRFHVTEGELQTIQDTREGRMTVSAGTGHVAYAGQPVGFFGIPVVVGKVGEVENTLF